MTYVSTGPNGHVKNTSKATGMLVQLSQFSKTKKTLFDDIGYLFLFLVEIDIRCWPSSPTPTPTIFPTGHTFSGRPFCICPLHPVLPVVFLQGRCLGDFGFYARHWFIEMTTFHSLWLPWHVCPRQQMCLLRKWQKEVLLLKFCLTTSRAELPVYFFGLLPCGVSGDSEWPHLHCVNRWVCARE